MLGLQSWVSAWTEHQRPPYSSSSKHPFSQRPLQDSPSLIRRRLSTDSSSLNMSSTPSYAAYGGAMEHFRHGGYDSASLMDISDATPGSRMPPVSLPHDQVNIKTELEGMGCASASSMGPQHPQAHGGYANMGGMGLSSGLHPHMMPQQQPPAHAPHPGHPGAHDRNKVHTDASSSSGVSVSTSGALASGDSPVLSGDHMSQPSSTTSGNGPSNKVPPKKRPLSVPEDLKDNSYWEKRKKNNESAKRSREARRMKEEQIAMRVVYLEQENLQLRTEVSLLKSEIEKLRCMLYNS